MPELPEVETIARGLRPRIVGRSVARIEVLTPRTMAFDEQLITEVISGYKISSVDRRAKILLWHLDSGYSLLFHLKMTGQIIYDGALSVDARGLSMEQTSANDQPPTSNLQPPVSNRFAGGHPTKSMDITSTLPDSSTRAVFHLDDGARVYFNDQRKFGWIKLLPTHALDDDEFIKRLGPEHDDTQSFTPQYLWSRTRNRITPIKALLLDQSIVAGIGNIYADESLHLARIHPATKASMLKKVEVLRLFDAILEILKNGIEQGGTSFTNYVNVLGTRGDYLEHSRVFKRQGLPCRVCRTLIIKTRVAGRGTHYCPTCQPKPKGWVGL